MAIASFSKKTPAPAPEAAPEAPKQAVAKSTAGPVATFAQTAQIQGEFTSADMAVPYLNLGQKSGKMTDGHLDWIGNWIYDKGTNLGKVVRVIFCRAKKHYEEDIEYGSEQIPQRFDTEADARAHGFSSEEIVDVANIDLLVECPTAEVAETFGMITVGDKSYAPARFIVRSTAYRATVGVLLKDLAGWLKNDLASGFYTMEAEKRSNAGNSWFAPKLATAGKVSPELRAVIQEKFGV